MCLLCGTLCNNQTKMKKYLKIILPLLFLSVLGYLAYQIITKIQHKKQVEQNIKQMPEFSYNTLENKAFTIQNLRKNTPTLFIYYNSECDFCNYEAKMVRENIDKLNTVDVVFISFEPLDKIKTFAQNHQLINHDYIYFLSDTKITFATTFDVKSMPCIVLYDKDRHLIEKIKGQTKVEPLLEKLGISPLTPKGGI